MARASKRDEILQVAGNLFIEKGFQAVSMDQIAAATPVSKPTLYAHFKDKRELFAAVVAARCEKILKTLKAGMSNDVDLQDGLTAFGKQFVDMLLMPSSLKFHRVMVAESENFPEMAELFYETGPKQMKSLLKDFLKSKHKHCQIVIPDPDLSAGIFIGMLKGPLHLRCLLGLEKTEISKTARTKLVKSSVDIFLHGHHMH